MVDNTTTQNITLSVPDAGITRDIEITPGATLTFDFNPKLVQYELSEDGDLILTFKNGGGYTFKGFAELDGDVNVSVNGLVVSMADFLINVADIDTAAGEKSLTSGQQGYEEGFGTTLDGIDNLTLEGDALTTTIDGSGSDLPDQQVFDVTPPEIGPKDLTSASDSGTFNNDNLTNITTPVFTGTSEAGALITVFANGNVIGTTIVEDDGSWEFESPVLEEGIYDITATATDDSGNTSDPTSPLTVEIDLTAPITPDITFTDNQDDIPAYINAEEVTGDGTPTTTVNVRVPDGARAGDTLVVTYNDINGVDQTVATVLTTQQVVDGVNLEIEATGEFELTVNASAFDPAGNQGGTTTSTILVDTVPPDAPQIDLQVDSRFDNDAYTNDGHLTFTGEAGATLSFTVVDALGNSIPTPAQTALTSGAFTFDMDSLPDGTYTVVATLTDAAGNTSAPQTFSYTLDQTNPDLVTINETLPEISQDVPFDPSLGLFVEQLDAGEPNVTFEITGGNDNGWFTLTPDGELSVTEEGINAGVMNFEQDNLGDGRTITIKTTDQAGNTSESDYTLNVTNVNERPDAADFSYTTTVDANIGLRANFYAFDNQTDLPPGIRWTHRNAFDYVEAHISNSDTPADAAFIAGQLDFGLQRGTLDTFDELSNFIAGSGSQLVDTRPDDNFDTYADRGIIKLEGSAFFEGGEHRIRVYSDDGFQLKIDGEVVASFYNDRAPGTTTVNIGELTEGYHDIEIIYWDQGGRYVLRVEDSVRPDGGAWSDFEVIGNNGGSPNTLVHNPLVTAEDNSLTIDTDLLLNEATDPDQGTTLSLVSDSLELRATVNGVDMTGTDIIPPVTENGITYTNEISGVGKIGTDTDGNIVFTPAEDYNGEASFTYQVIDDGSPQLTSDPATVTLNVTPVNDAPEALDTASYDDGIEDQALVITRAELLSDLDIQDVEDGQNVLLDIAATNSNIKSITYDQNSEEFTIIPKENFNGDVTLRLSIEDQDGATTYRAINANFDPVNDIPTANLTADFDTGVEDQTLYITRADLISSLNIDDVEDGQNVILDLTTTNPNIQSIAYDAVNEQYVIEPVENFNGDVQFNLSITDQEGASIQRSIGANFDPVNDVPTADLTTNFDTGVEDQPLYITRADLISSLNIDDVEDGQNVILDLTTTNPNIQSITYDAVNEQYVIEPVENFNGDVQFNLSITDQEGASIQRTIGANFDPVNDVPTADITTDFDTGVEDQTLYITRADLISSLNIDDVEDGQNVILDLTTTNPNIQSITYDAVNEQYVIEPVENFNGDVQFNLSITDQEGASIQRTIGANFDPVNDVPTADLITNFDTGVEDQTLYITRADLISSLNIDDVEDGQNVILDLTTTNPNIQSITYDAVNEQYVIEPVENFNGDVQFNLSITDQEGASIQRTIGANFDPVNDVPTADLTTNFDTGVEDQTLYITRADLISSLNIDDVEDGQNVILDLTTTNPNIQSITYDAVNEQYVIEPVENFNGDVQFNLSITDHEGASIQRTVGVNFDPRNDAPTGADAIIGVIDEDATVPVTFTAASLINDMSFEDIDGDNLTLTYTPNPVQAGVVTYEDSGGQTVVLQSGEEIDPTVTYSFTPAPNADTDFVFDVTATDPSGASATETATIDVLPINDAPILVFETPTNTNPNIIVNGSFEDTDGVVISSGGWKGFNVLPGWTKTEFDGDGNPIDPRDQLEVHDEAHGNIGTADGDNYMDLGASPGSSGRIGNVGMTQVIADGAIEEGQPYQLTFFIKNKAAAFNSNNADSADLRVVWNSLEVPIDLPDATGPDWVEVTVTVTAGAGDNTLTFYETGEGGDNHGMAVDNISLVQVSTITAPVTISEDTPTDTVIAHAVASDVDSENLTFSFADGSLEQNGFVIDPISGEIKVAEGGPFNETGEPFDVDAQGASDTITLDVKVDDNDGATTTQQLVITIQDINDNQVIFDPALSDDGTTLPDYTFTVTETDTAVGQVTASDIDRSAGEITYSLENPDGSTVAGFEIDQNGNIAVTDPNAIDVEADSANIQQTYVVRATSEDGSVSTQEITINVQDVNDNPVIFDPAQNNDGSPAPNYMFTMAETEGVVGTITAQDADLTSGTITYSLENPDGSPLQGFTIDQNGEITVTDPTAIELDPDGANEFQSFVVRAQSEDGSETTQTVQLTVEPINEHQLNFTDSTIQPVTIEETVNPEDGTRLVTQVEAKDFDYTENVTYELLNHTDKFEIDSQTGEITVKQGVVLDNATEGALESLGSAYETNGIYTLTEATMNESGAVWSNKTLDLTQDFTIKADLFFGSSPGGEGITFILHAGAVDPATTAGGSNLGANIDNAIVVEFDTNKNRSQDDPGFDHIAIHTDGDVSHESRPVQLFNIEDRDWHEATFNWDATNEIFTVSFEGRTATLNGDITQHLANNTEVNFGFTGTTADRGNLQQVNILSIDGIDQVYDLEVQATSADTDPSTPSEVITTTVPVTITASPDVNVNDVIFDDPEAGDGNTVEDFTFTISETANEVGTVTANDADYRSGDITYSLENADGSPVNGFAIDEDGVITVTDPDAIDVDPDGANASQSFLVRAQSDDGSEATQEITINVQDINDNAVIFAPAEANDGTELPNYRFAITETDGFVGTVTASDNDYTSGNITYSLSKPDGSPAEGYAIDSNGVITITDPDVVDIDPDGANITQRLIVTAESEDGSASAQPITISVQDVNDNAVIFAPAEANDGSQLPNYAFTITEADAVVGTVAASDNDYSAGSISYSLENPDGSTAKGFAIDQDGNITVTDPTAIDLEADNSNALQNLTVRAVSEDGSINTQQITVAVQDVNEHPIIFDPAQNNDGSPASNFIFTMNETDGVVGTITAQDADVSSGNITYTLENQDGTPLEGFSIDEHGTITVTNPDAIELDPDGANELQNFVVRALSEDGSEKTQNVQLNIEPVNEHALDFTDSTIQPVTIEETVNAEDGTRLVTQVEAKDFDYTENVTYELLNHTDKFEIDPQTGEITVKEGVILDNEGGSATFNALGTAYESNGIFTLTDPTYSQDGAIWSDQKLDLTQDFTITADLFLGSSNGADGITFVLHPDGFTPDDTTHGGSLGANIGNAVVVEFDTYRNSDLGDPWHDHVSIHTDGDLRHGADHSQAIQTSNLEDGLWHEATFTWDASAEVFTVSFEGKTAVLTGGLSQHLGNSTTAHFGFTGTTGGLYNLQQVNVKSVEGLDITYDLQVQATSADADPDTPSEVVTTTVPVTVTASEEVNVNDVIFDGATNSDGSNADDFSFNVTETSDTIGTISASDADYRSGDISFSLETTNGEPVQGYAIDSNGVITVTDQSVLDVDPDGINALQNIIVRATSDDGSESTQTITINVQDVDDNPVVFAPAEDSDGSPVANYTFTITEADTNIGTVTATDNDFTAGTITYSLETKDGNPVQGFAIDADGNISITDPTVVDIDPDGANALQNLVVRAEAEDGSVNTQTITINVQDVDDNPVVFAPAEDSDGSPVANYTFTITETDTNIGTVTATDNDFTAGTITYSLETKDGNPVQGFAIDADGNISITDPTVVDIDPDGANALQNIVVRAEAEDGSVNTQTITINIQDVDDNPVVFAPAEDSDGSPVANYTFTITEADTNIGTVTATDNDFTAGTITYSLETKDGNPVQGFAIDADGNISITDPTVVDIDPDGANALQNIVVRAEAEDGSVNTQTITINVQDVDDNPVVFAPAEDSDGSPVANYTFTITETDTNIGTVTATDSDFTAGTITYSLETKDGNPVQGFAIDADGNISITDPTVVDIDQGNASVLQNIVVRAEAEDGSVNTQTITINIQDVDDNPVVFAPAEDSDGSPVANYTFTITETDTNIGTVTATDNDFTAGTITYSLETKDGNPVQGFAIDADGNISITDPTVVDIDPDGANALQNIVVRAEAEDGSANTQTITINVQDVNDNEVIFGTAENNDGSPANNYLFNITEEDTAVGRITASDNDFSAGNISYSLETIDGAPALGFAIDQNGAITVTDPSVIDITTGVDNVIKELVVKAQSEDGSENTQQISINIENLNSAPTVTGQVDLGTMDEDTTITITKAQLLANASDLDNDQLSVLNLTTDSGALYDNNDGTWSFTPGKDFSGDIALNFEVSDGSVSVPTGGILAVNAIADAPSLFIQVANVDAEFNDTADFSNATEGVSFDLTDHDSQTVAGEADRWETDEVTGSRFDDVFSFDNLEAGETYTVHGGGGTNTIDLSNFTGNNVTIDHEAGTLTVEVDADGNTATINYDNVSVVEFDSNVFDGTPHSVELDNHDWQINGTSIEVTSQGRNDWAVSPINFSGSLDENFTLNITVVAHDDGPWYNGAIVFDYQDANNYKMAVARIGADRWTIEQVENGRHSNVATTDYIRLDTNVPNVIDLEIEGSVATIFSNGVRQVSHDFGEPLNDGQIGVATNNSHTSFDINLRPSNWAPSVENYDVKIQVQDGGFTSQNVLADAFDPEGAELNITGFTQAKHGAVVDNGDGTFSYTPAEGFVGVDSFTYSITDGDNTTEGTITVDVQSDAAISILRGEGFVLDVGASLTDLDDSETLTVQLEGVPEGTTITDGTTTITVGANGIADVTSMYAAELLFTPPEDYNASFDVTVQAIATEPNGSTSVTSSSFDVVILNADIPTTGSIDILGDAEVGNLLTADISSLIDPDGDIGAEYQWYRGAGDNKEAIDGATSNEYTLVEADTNQQVSVEVRAGDADGIPVTFTENTTFVAANPEFQGFTQSRELLLNGDFEDGAAHWTNDYGSVELQQIGSWIWGDSNDSGAGDKFAELSADNVSQNNLKQTVVVDSASDSVTLKFDYKARLDGFGTQQFSVFLGSVLVAEDLVSSTQWQTFELTLPVSDLNLDESGELTLEFYEDTNLTVGVMLDDISLVENLQSTSSTIHIDNDISQDGILANLAEFDENSVYTLTNPDGSTSEDFAISDSGQLTALSSGADLPSGITKLNLTITNAEGESSTTNIVLTKDTVDDIIYSSSDDFGGQPIVLDGNAINDETGINDATDRFHIEGHEDVLIINFDATQGDTLDISSVLGGSDESIDLSASNIEEYVDISGDSGNFTIKVKSETQDTPEQVITIQDATGLEDQAALIQMLIQNN